MVFTGNGAYGNAISEWAGWCLLSGHWHLARYVELGDHAGVSNSKVGER